jgi:hypothetical protein
METKMKRIIFTVVAIGALTACAQTSIQQLSQNTFQVSTTTAPVCGRSGATKVSSKIAAIEVIKRGGDRFVILTANSGSEYSGMIMARAAGNHSQDGRIRPPRI